MVMVEAIRRTRSRISFVTPGQWSGLWFKDIKYRICVAYEVMNLTLGSRAALAHTVLATTDPEGKLLLRTPDEIVARLLPASDSEASA